ncbi:EAP30/Vps36 family-domain-containing protein [Papiliotrema laurentii]|uniref:Vacuolar protein-sorting-associated protein 36 n=1 Tax=Papiliotrema laurentii TaxID=5418 RepID=A0AAD9D2V2_PAPLA|nr:EAP30/Vps36 family-domain-containing protein [Papiliotrema laurentii]
MRSSPKITLTLGRPASVGNNDAGLEQPGAGTWTCSVCGYVNDSPPLGISRQSMKCGLCGVGWETSRSISAPVSRVGTPTPLTGAKADAARPSATQPSTTRSSMDVPETASSTEIACPACTFLNHPSLRNCEICSTPLPRRSSTLPSQASPSPPLAPAITTRQDDNGGTETVRLSFRKGGVQEAYRRLKNVLSDKVWERTSGMSRFDASASNGSSTPRAGAGIDGILQSISLDAKNQEEHRKEAFKDLEVLMVRAGEMVKMAQSLSAKLSASGSTTEEDASLIRSSLVQLGLPSPALTQDMVRDEQKYTEGLAMELGHLLTGHADSTSLPGSRGGLMVGKEGRGVIGLDEVWGLWMRARGVALLPPATLMAILPLLPGHTRPPINVLVLPSSLNVLHTPSYAPAAILSRLASRLTPADAADHPATDSHDETSLERTEKSLSLVEIASHESLPIGLTKELMESIEQVAVPPGVREPVGIVRDDQAVGDGGVRWYRDIISGWQL